MGTLKLDDGSYRRVLAREEVEDLLNLFDRLDPFGDGEPFFEVKAAGAVFIVGPKKYVVIDDTGNVVAHTEAVLGGFVPPPGSGSKGKDGRYRFTADIARAHAEREDGLLRRLSFEDVAPEWPALERHQLSSPEAAAQMPEALGCRPFSRVVEAISTYGDCHPVALDPGGEITDMGALGFYDTRSNRAGEISADPEARGTFVVDSLRAQSVEWGMRTFDELPDVVVLDPLLARPVGKSGGLFVDGSAQPTYAKVDEGAVLVAAAAKLGAAVIAEVYRLPARTARAIAQGRRPALATVRRAMSALGASLGPDPLPRLLDLAEEGGLVHCRWPDCEELPTRPGTSWCPRHRSRSGVDRARANGGEK